MNVELDKLAAEQLTRVLVENRHRLTEGVGLSIARGPHRERLQVSVGARVVALINTGKFGR
jgi:hypothetical protein